MKNKRGKVNSELCDALSQNEVNGKPVKRGGEKDVCFSDRKSKYCTLGKIPMRAGKGTLEKAMPTAWTKKVMSDFARKVEESIREFIPSNVIQAMHESKELLKYDLMRADSYSSLRNELDFFSSVAYGMNCFLSAHVDDDAFFSFITIQTWGNYELDASPAAYFCFPKYGVAVPLRPGDHFLFNPLETHCMSSPVQEQNPCYTIAFYLKTANVGGNDNSLPLTADQMAIIKNTSS